MSKTRLNVTQGLCDHVQILMKGGATAKTAGFLTGISQSTVSRIMAAGYDAEQFKANNEQRREKDNTERQRIKQLRTANELQSIYSPTPDELRFTQTQAKAPEDQVPGQMTMDLLGNVKMEEPQDMNKMMRFQAAQVDKILMKLSQLNDNVCQLLRAVNG